MPQRNVKRNARQKKGGSGAVQAMLGGGGGARSTADAVFAQFVGNRCMRYAQPFSQLA